ncbi:hypothetical protein [Kosakonia oryziphila]|uniref:Uncharacterized protein n=1 Tax=Kosakonia oryziphila TaxID=1005667 RepID=A0A1C4GC11_9ENTR|nr:hypothetical protein [Kosakonia oryziphila]SCC65674.1 hypothetical protein GA0061070_106117 [Kosakonia oryziphila]
MTAQLSREQLKSRIEKALKDFTEGRAAMHVPPLDTDVDMVLADCLTLLAGMDSEPSGYLYRTNTALACSPWRYTDKLPDYVKGEGFEIRPQFETPRHAPPAPGAVPEMTDAMALDFIKDKYLFDDVLRATKLAWNACRAAMQAEPVSQRYTLPDIDMSDADCFAVARLHEIIYGAKLQGQEAKLLARFMLDVKQRTAAPEQEV